MKCGVVFVCLSLAGSVMGGSDVLYETGFEDQEGYQFSQDLDGQEGWLGTFVADDGNTGFLDGVIELGNQSAYIGFGAPLVGEDGFVVWQPIQPAPDPAEIPVVHFSVVMTIFDSLTVEERDCFGWAVFNQAGDRLFTLAFNNNDLGIYYFLENGTNAVHTDFVFENEALYDLEIQMDFQRNEWLACLGGVTVVSNVPITEFDSPLDLGDVDAEWFYSDPGAPGDNYMVFDDYRVKGVAASDAPTMIFVERRPNGVAVVRLQGKAECRYALEASGDLVSWVTLTTAQASEGMIEFTDAEAAAVPNRFYRARVVP